MAEKETRVLYKAIADFSALSRSVRAAKKNVDELRRAEDRLNSESAAASGIATAAQGKHAKAVKADSAEVGKHSGAVRTDSQVVRDSTVAFIESASAKRSSTKATKDLTSATTEAGTVSKTLSDTIKRTANSHKHQKRQLDATRKSIRKGSSEISGLGRAFTNTLAKGNKLNKGLNTLGNWRPRLIPPFIALIPIIGGLLALMNPLVAGLGAVGIAGYGFASSLGSIAGAAVAVVPGLAGLLSMVFAVKKAFGGVGSVFSAFTKMNEASGGGGGGAAAKETLTRAEQLARAQEDYRRAIEDVTFAEEELDDARKDALDRMNQLQKAVDRAAASEARARANSQLARENYANVLADPGSTKGEKMDAKVGIDEAGQSLRDVLEENIQNQKDLLQTQKDGIEGDRQVIMAKRGLVDAIDRERDAYLDLRNVQSGANDAAGGAASATDEFKAALDKLSPSARAVVLALIDMKDEWDALGRTVQEAFFSEVVGDVESLLKLIPVLTTLLSDAAGAAGRVTSRFVKMVTSAAWLEDLGTISKQSVPQIENVGDGILFIIDAMKDLAVAAGPFAIALSEGFKTGSDNFRDMIATARQDGSLAAWLDKVLGRMQQWWRIIKNIGKTLFNYGAATEVFGKWLTDGFEKTTKGWLDASRKAREAGSPFQKYLEDVKPLLSEMKGLFGDFFSWFAKVAADPASIKGMTDIVAMFRDELGPALGRVFDILNESGVGEDLVDAIVSIVEAIATFLENGGIEGFKTFYDTVSGLFDALNGFLSSVPAPVLSLLSSSFATLAALRFFGLTKLLGLLLTVGKSAGLLKVLDKLPLIGAAGAKGKHATASGSVAAAGGKHSKPAAPRKGGFASRLGGRAAGGLKGGIAGLIASLVVGTVADEVIKDGKGGARDTGGGLLAGAATGAGVGALAGSVVPGVGTAAGAVVGGAVGAGAAAVSMTPEQWEQTGTEISDWWKTITAPLEDFGYSIGVWWEEKVTTPFGEAIVSIQTWWKENVITPFEAFTAAMSRGWTEYVTTPFNAAIANIKTWWQEKVTTPFSAAIASIKLWWAQYVTTPFSAAISTIKAAWSQYVTTPFSGAIAGIKAAWAQYVTTPFGAAIDGIKSAWDAFLNFDLSDTLTNFFNGMFKPKEKKNNGGVIRRAGGGGVPGSGNSDTVPAMLTPGEFVVRKAIVGRVGLENLQKFNSGVMDYASLLNSAAANQSTGKTKQESNLSFFGAGGLVPSMPSSGPPSSPSFPQGPTGGSESGSGFSVGELTINNPAPEPASDSLPRTIRKMTYLGGKR